MDKLNLPPYPYKLKEDKGGVKIFDIIRRSFVKLTPEEWVRQHFLNYLIDSKSYPRGLIQIEKEIKIDSLKRRPDLVVCDKSGRAILIAEFKSTKVGIDEDVFFQIALYNKKLHVPYLVLSNGLDHYCARIDHDTGKIFFLDEIPDYRFL